MTLTKEQIKLETVRERPSQVREDSSSDGSGPRRWVWTGRGLCWLLLVRWSRKLRVSLSWRTHLMGAHAKSTRQRALTWITITRSIVVKMRVPLLWSLSGQIRAPCPWARLRKEAARFSFHGTKRHARAPFGRKDHGKSSRRRDG